MRLPRLTTGRLMVIVAVCAFLIWSMMMTRRSAEFRRRADYHQSLELIANHSLRDYIRAVALDVVRPPDDPRLQRATFEPGANDPELAAYHAVLKRKYRHAARYPWLPVPPDPPEPK